MTNNEIIKLRSKPTGNGNRSLYLDLYYKGDRRYEFLHLYLVPERTKSDRLKNEDTLQLANAIKFQRTADFFNDLYGFPSKKNDVNLIQYIEQVSDNKQKIGKNGVPGSLRMLIYHLKKYKGDRILLKDVDVKYLNGFVRYLSSAISANSGRQKRTLKQSTQHNIFASLKMIIHQAIKDELLTHDPTKSVDSPTTVQSHKEYLTESELKKLIATPSRNEVVKTAFLFCCFTGLRLSDVRNLTWNHITTGSDNQKQLNFRQKKTKIENYIPLSYNAISQLPEQHSSDSVFPLPSDNAIRETLKKWVSDSGIDKHITFHCSRHTFATMMLTLGVDIYTTSKLLGHANVTTTTIYAKIVDKKKVDAMNLVNDLFTKDDNTVNYED